MYPLMGDLATASLCNSITNLPNNPRFLDKPGISERWAFADPRLPLWLACMIHHSHPMLNAPPNQVLVT